MIRTFYFVPQRSPVRFGAGALILLAPIPFSIAWHCFFIISQSTVCGTIASNNARDRLM